jgi:hypothetical protein
MRSDAMAMLLSAGFRGLQSRANQLWFLRYHPVKFLWAIITILFKPSVSTLYRTIPKPEKANDQNIDVLRPSSFFRRRKFTEWPAQKELRSRKCSEGNGIIQNQNNMHVE